MKTSGVILLELLLVIIVAAAIITMSLNYYRLYERNMQLHLIDNDLLTVRQALDEYYVSLPCDSEGILTGDILDQDLISRLDINDSGRARLPLIVGYHAYIIDTGTKTSGDVKKPIYQLQVRADINPEDMSQLQWLSQRLDANRIEGNTLYWESLPNSLAIHPSKVLWVMSGSVDAFQKLTNNPDINGNRGLHAYCAR